MTTKELNRLEMLVQEAVFLWRAYMRDKCTQEQTPGEGGILGEFESLAGEALRELRGHKSNPESDPEPTTEE